MILRQGFSLNVEISGNMKNQRNPFPHRSKFPPSVQVLLFVNISGPKCIGVQVSKTNDVLLNVRYMFFNVYWIL